MPKFFVYELLDPRVLPPLPFYVGISKENNKNYRPRAHIAEAKKSKLPKNSNRLKINKIRKILASGEEPIIRITHEFSDRYSVIAQEIASIAKYGRLDKGTGILTNLTDGGDGPTGRVYTSEERQRISLRLLGKNNGMFGKTHSDVARTSISEKKKGRIMHSVSEHQKAAICLSNSTRVISDRVKERGRLALTGNTYKKGVKWTDVQKANLSNSKTGKYRRNEIYVWSHPEHGEHVSTKQELMKRHALRPEALGRVITGFISHHKGWTCKGEFIPSLLSK